MTKLVKMLMVVVAPTMVALFGGPARPAFAQDEAPAVTETPSSTFPSRRWVARAEGAMLAVQSGSIGPHVETGITVGRFVASRLAVEGTLMDGPDSSWSAMANARWEPLRTRGGGHAFTLAGGPLVVVNNGVHGTTPLVHTELAYVYRASFGLTTLVGAGLNVATTDSSYVPPDSCFLGCPGEIHRGDLLGHVRVGIGWTF